MLNLLPLDKKLSLKCAEIYYHKSVFTIQCYCGESELSDYNLFLQHFHDEHLGQPHEGSLHIGATKPHQNDPLECKVITDIPVNESATITSSDQNLRVAGATQAENLSCLSEPKIINLTTCGENVHMIKSCSDVNITFSDDKGEIITEELPAVYQTTASGNNYDDEFNNENNIDVDWSKPFAPNLLKNQDKRPYKPRNKPNTCGYCGREFRRRYQLDTHLNIHTGLKPHQCEICGRQFRAITTLMRHRTTHEKREAFQCQHCDKHFNHRAALLSHELRHTQQRSVRCSNCSKIFYTYNQMDTHRRKVHLKNGDLNDAGIATQPLPFGCDICAKSYRSASMLSTHKLKKHHRMAKYSCEHCERKFVDETRLRAHTKIHVKGDDAEPYSIKL